MIVPSGRNRCPSGRIKSWKGSSGANSAKASGASGANDDDDNDVNDDDDNDVNDDDGANDDEWRKQRSVCSE